MDTEKSRYVAIADAMKLGEQRFFSPILLRAAFRDRRAIDGTQYGTPESAFIASLIGGKEGHYILCEHQHRYGYVLSREGHPNWQDF